jgi:hypothetical protein
VRRSIFIGFLLATSLVATPIARASDDSVRQVVKDQATRQVKADAKFRQATKSINSKAKAKKARTATSSQIKSIDTFHDAVAAEQADSGQVKAGRNQLLKGLSMYNHGLEKLKTALTQAIKTNGRGGEASAKAALKTLLKALKQVESGAKKING